MKNILKNHPILIAILLGLFMTISMFALSLMNGNHYYYRISYPADEISDIKITQKTEGFDSEPIYLLKQTSIEYNDDAVLIHFDAVQAGNGILRVEYTRKMPQGNKVTYSEGAKLVVSATKIVLVGDNMYNRNGFSVAHVGVTLYSLLMVLYLIWRRRYLSKNDRYSYAYMSTWSGELFFGIIFFIYATTAVVSAVWLKYVDISLLSNITRYLMLLMTAVTFPIILVFSISMTISNLSLIRHEGKRLNNMLGIFAGTALFGALMVIMLLFVLFLIHGRDSAPIAILYSMANALYIVFFCTLAGSIISGLQAGFHTPAMDKDFIIILGCKIRKDGTLYPLIRGRVDRAIEFWKAQEKKTGKKAIFVPSGGQGSDEVIAEGEAMKKYLLEQGIPEEYILAETKSATTFENMKFSKELIESVNPSANIAFSTTNYHVMRGGIHAAQAGVKAEGMGAPTKWYFWPNALLREVVGMFAYQPKLQILTMLTLAILAGAAGYGYFLFM